MAEQRRVSRHLRAATDATLCEAGALRRRADSVRVHLLELAVVWNHWRWLRAEVGAGLID
jgi:hypothetical protein